MFAFGCFLLIAVRAQSSRCLVLITTSNLSTFHQRLVGPLVVSSQMSKKTNQIVSLEGNGRFLLITDTLDLTVIFTFIRSIRNSTTDVPSLNDSYDGSSRRSINSRPELAVDTQTPLPLRSSTRDIPL